MAQHTPGPWARSGQFFIKAENGWVVAEVRKPNGRGKEYVEEFPYAQANARLIAAAPELLEALQGFVSDCTNEECERCLAGRAAIARATGQA